jgi:membrane-bound inhibitor of C-type lysozyme
MRHNTLCSLCCLSLLSLSACVTKNEVSSLENTTVQYECDRGTQLLAIFSKDGSNVEISTNTVKNLKLPSQATGSGFIYSNGRYELRGKGEEATWSVGRMASEHCLASH